METIGQQAQVQCERTGDTVTVSLLGDWHISCHRPSLDVAQAAILEPVPPRTLVFACEALGHWDSSLLTYLRKLREMCEVFKIACDMSALPEGVTRLLLLAEAVPEAEDAHQPKRHRSFLYRLGQATLDLCCDIHKILTFLGEVSYASMRFFVGKARFRKSDIAWILEDTGANSLPIVALISFLVGMIMAFVGSIQLVPFGADVYVANLVGIAMVREMGAMMAGIIMAGRTGAAFAAQLGSMRVTEEIDALATFGFSPVEFLVLPRVIALSLMMPLLCVFADFIGMFGGMFVTVSLLDVSIIQYINQTIDAVTWVGFCTGVVKSYAFGILVACAGCMRGMACGGSSSSVGEAATSAVVTGITAIIIADALFAIIFNILGV